MFLSNTMANKTNWEEQKKINFTVGPCQSFEKSLMIASENTPYFRTDAFSEMMIENEKMYLQLLDAPLGSHSIFLTASGTGAMDSIVSGLFSKNNKVIIINGGTFGERFTQICSFYNISFYEIKLDFGKNLKKEDLYNIDGSKYDALLVNLDETSSGTLYDIDLVSNYCKKYNLLLIVDAISAFLTDYFSMKASNIDVVITSSQKALACQPGISMIAISKRAIKIISKKKAKSYYLDLKVALEQQMRGQTPYTPAVTTLLQINQRLKEIINNGGIINEINRTNSLAKYFRKAIVEHNLPFDIIAESPSNAVTCLHPRTISAFELFKILEKEYNIWICPNGGLQKDNVFRVGHIGNLNYSDYDKLIECFEDLIIKNKM